MGLLGLRSAPDSIPLLDSLDLDFLAAHDAFFDNPIPFRYRELAEVCPNARWIATQRPLDGWLGSMEWLFGEGLDRLSPKIRAVGDRVHRNVYGTDRFDPGRLTDIYNRHYSDLSDWLTGRPSVWIDVDEGIMWQPICDLLGIDEPTEPFPHANKRNRHR